MLALMLEAGYKQRTNHNARTLWSALGNTPNFCRRAKTCSITWWVQVVSGTEALPSYVNQTRMVHWRIIDICRNVTYAGSQAILGHHPATQHVAPNPQRLVTDLTNAQWPQGPWRGRGPLLKPKPGAFKNPPWALLKTWAQVLSEHPLKGLALKLQISSDLRRIPEMYTICMYVCMYQCCPPSQYLHEIVNPFGISVEAAF